MLRPIEINVKTTAYDRYCAENFSEGKYCLFVRLKAFNTKARCALYEEELYVADYVERCPQCLKNFPIAVSQTTNES